MFLPSTRQLQYFVALADQQSFSRAAQACNVTQSTLSAGIAALESLLGQELVDRTQKHILLTPLGTELLERARKIIADAADMVERARHLSAPLAGPLRLGVIPTIAPYFLPRILPAIKAEFPDLELQLHEDLSARLYEGLKNGSLDLVLLAFPYETPGMSRQELFSEAFLLACPKGKWRQAPPVKLDDLKSESLILLEEGHCLRDHALEACKLQPAQQKRTFSATSLPTLIQMVQHGYGITLLPEMAVRWGSLPDNIEVFSFRDPPPLRSVGVLWRSGSARETEFLMLAGVMAQAYEA